MMNNLRRCVVPTLRNCRNALGQRSAGNMAATSSSASALRPTSIGPASFYHSGRVMSNAQDNKHHEVFLTEEMITAMEYHYEQSDVTDLNLFLKHPSSPKIMAWHPDLIFDGDTIDFVRTDEPMEFAEETPLSPEDELEMTTVAAVDSETVSRPKLSFMNRNARFGTKASKGKRPVSRQARRRKKRSIGNHRR